MKLWKADDKYLILREGDEQLFLQFVQDLEQEPGLGVRAEFTVDNKISQPILWRSVTNQKDLK